MVHLIQHPAGVVVFPGVVEIDQEFLSAWVERRSASIGDNTGYTDRRIKTVDGAKIDKDGNYVNADGYKFTPGQFKTTPPRLVGLLYDVEPEDKAFVEYLDGVMATCLHEYINMYPEVSTSIWYRTPSHAVLYTAGHEIGLHSDQTTERGKRAWGTGVADPSSKPINEFPTKTVVTGSLILRDTAEGGTMYFPHAGVRDKFAVGSAVFYPSNFIGAHSVETITSGERISYLQFYCQGMPLDGQEETHVDAWYNAERKWVSV